MKTLFSSPRPFWLNLLLILGAVTLVAWVAFLIYRNTTVVSNTYFLGAFALWIVAVVPVFTEIGDNTKIRRDAHQEGKRAREMIKAQEEKYRRGGRVTFLYGIAGFICFALALITA